MEKFLKLPEKKRNTIINAALKTFGATGYKKTSANDIAAEAGISKAMIFHYFGTKKALYIYLINLCSDLLMTEISRRFDYNVTDFFDRLKLVSSIKLEILKKHPPITSFLTSMYFEEDKEVKADIKAVLSMGVGFANKIVYEGIDYSKFKADVDIKILMKMLSWIADGYAKQLSNNTEIDYDALFKEFDDCLDLLKNNFYKKEN